MWSIGMILIFILGIMANMLYIDVKNERFLNGIQISGANNTNEALEIAYERDSKGDWVCINVAYDMKPELAYSTCVHECSHEAFSEIYAEKCESDPEKCLEVLNE